MKIHHFCFFAQSFLLLAATIPSNAAITINFSIGQLRLSNGIDFVQEGSLLQLIASTTDDVFTAPNATSFVGDSLDDIILASFSLDPDLLNLEGTTSFELTDYVLSGNLSVGDHFLLRWFPTLTGSSLVPGGGISYGQFRTDEIRDASTINWTIPSDGVYTLNFVTESFDGSQPNSAGIANLMTIPEPGAYAVWGLGVLAGAVLFRRRSKA